MYAPWLKYFNIDAIALWKWVLYSTKDPSPFIVNHERIHLDQIKRDGCLYFYIKYVLEYIHSRLFKGMNHNQAYITISYEQEAYNNQYDFNYQVKYD